jgi:hypothetical protein
VGVLIAHFADPNSLGGDEAVDRFLKPGVQSGDSIRGRRLPGVVDLLRRGERDSN